MPGSVGVGDQGSMTNSAAGILPKMTGGQAAVTMNEMMNGSNANAASQSHHFLVWEILVLQEDHVYRRKS